MNIAIIATGLCIAFYALMTYLETREFLSYITITSKEFIKQHGDKFLPDITENVTVIVSNYMIENPEFLKVLGVMIYEASKEDIKKAGAKDYEKFKRN